MKLKELRQDKDITQKELADAIGTDEPMISKFENYKCIPIPKMMEVLVQVLGCELEDLYEPHEIYVKYGRRKRKRKQNVYRLTAELPEEARVFLRSGALQKCGFKDVTAWANWCFERLKATYENLEKNDKEIRDERIGETVEGYC